VWQTDSLLTDTIVFICIFYSDRWSNSENLYIYGESNGLISDFAMDASNELFDKLFAVGSFDTEHITSQIQLCSVGEYDGLKSNGFGFTKVQ